MYLDACLTGLGGHFDSMVYALDISFDYNNYDICHLEMLNIGVASKLWACHWKYKKIQINCDNMALVQVLNTGRACDPILATYARNVWLIATIYNIEFIFTHIVGQANLLSCWSTLVNPIEKLNNLLPK